MAIFSKAPCDALETKYCIQYEWSAVSSKVTLLARRSGGSGNAQKKRSARLYYRILTLGRVDQKIRG